jgi:hypothetical protein
LARSAADSVARHSSISLRFSITNFRCATLDRNRRPDDLKAFVDHLVNWEYLAEMYRAAAT